MAEVGLRPGVVAGIAVPIIPVVGTAGTDCRLRPTIGFRLLVRRTVPTGFVVVMRGPGTGARGGIGLIRARGLAGAVSCPAAVGGLRRPTGVGTGTGRRRRGLLRGWIIVGRPGIQRTRFAVGLVILGTATRTAVDRAVSG